MNEEFTYNLIFNLLQKEDAELTKLTNKGIFYAPELYIAFIIGKELKKNENQIFGENVEWQREISIGTVGPTDVAFVGNLKSYAIELKLRDTVDSYSADIKKLQGLPNNYVKYFIALIDSWDNDSENEFRITELEKEYPTINRISEFKTFVTEQERYKRLVCCNLAIWKIK